MIQTILPDNKMTIALVCLLIVVFVMLIITDYNYTKTKDRLFNLLREKEDTNVDKMKILLEENAVNKIDEVLDTYINNAAVIYQVLEIAKSQKEYLNNEDIERMIAYITTMVQKNMTKESVALLSLTHVIDNDNDLNDLIKLRTKLYVLNFSIGFNELKE